MLDFTGEPGGTRTRDPLIKSQMLYQLSYRPLENQLLTESRVNVEPFERPYAP
jgi:hypothetical protein